MTYAQARSYIRSGDLLAFGHEGWRGWHSWEVQAVRAFTRSEYAHVGVAWVIGERVLVIEAVVPQVRIFPLSRLLPCYWLADEPRKEWTMDDEERALSKVGQEYSKWEAIRTFFGKVVPGANDKWQCAEIAGYIRGASGVKPTPTRLVSGALIRGASIKYLQP